MGSGLTVVKGDLTLTVEEPSASERTLRGRCSFARWDAETWALVELRLVSRKHRHLFGPRPWRQELWVPPCRAKLLPGKTGIVDFHMPYPALAAPFQGGMLDIAVMVVVEPSKGPAIHLFLENAPQPAGAHRVVKGLPIRRSFRRPLRWLTFRPILVTIEDSSEGEPRLRVTVQGDPVRGGTASLVAAEFEIEAGDRSAYKHEPLYSAEKPLETSDQGLQATFPIPPPSEKAPPSMTLKGPQTRQGIVWEIRLDLLNRRGKRNHVAVPVTLATEG
jgi:hypothetical protein